MKQILFATVFLALLLNLNPIPKAYAQIIPAADSGTDCKTLEKTLKSSTNFRNAVAGKRDALSNHLGCAIKTGEIHMFMMPFFITYIIQFLLQLAGIVAIFFILLGGYYYVLGGLGEDKEKGKKTMRDAIIGLVVALSAWVIVNFIQVVLTS